MKQFLKDNIAIVAAIGLPLILTAIFALSTLARTVTVADPQYDFLVTSNYYDANNTAFRIEVVQDKLEVAYQAPSKDQNGYEKNSSVPRLWRVHVPEMSVEEIALRIPEIKKSAPVDIPGLTDVKVTNLQPGPDGYTFDTSYYYSGNLMSELFAADGKRRSRVGIYKDGRSISISAPASEDWRYNARFVGWIVPEKK